MYLGETRMKNRKGFTLVELMVVVVIVALLAALLIPMLTARIEAARWSEGRAAAGTIATALRAYIIEVAELEGDMLKALSQGDPAKLAEKFRKLVHARAALSKHEAGQV